ncbi:MAG: hypothetical protein M1609_01095 [Firmicutes bacterium]|nr:hypothetical protein [Bacillota bacterium]
MWVLRYSEAVVYVISLSMVISAALIIYNLQFLENQRTVYRLRLLEQVRKNTAKTVTGFYNEQLERLLVSTGRPFGLNSIRYNLLRLSILGGWFIYLNSRWLIYKGRYPYNILSLIVSLLILSHPYKGLPLFRLLGKINELRLREKNKECFTLYSMIQNEFYTDLDRPLNMYATLNKLKPYFKAIDRALGKAILLWKKSPAKALDAFAVEVGTEEAKDLAQILKNIDASNPKDARDILDSRYEQFVTKRHESHRRYRNNLGLIGYVAAFLPVFAVIYNAMVVFNLEKQDLLRFLSQR